MPTAQKVASRQITSGPRHHFFGYIGHCRTIPWNASNRYVLCLETTFQDRMPLPADAADILLLDAQNNFAPTRLDATRAWNPQQGTMLYWNPAAADTQFFFNDRDLVTGKVFTVLYDVAARRRIREYRFDDTPVANGGVAQNGGAFMAINYGRLGRLRPVTGYPEAFDWTCGVAVPEDDGVFRVDVATGEKRLVCAFPRMVEVLVNSGAASAEDTFELFLNHTLWNREDDLVWFYLRSGPNWGPCGGRNLNVALSMRPDGSELSVHGPVGGHPEWLPGSKMLADGKEGLRIYDPRTKNYVATLGTREIFFDSKGDKALSPDGTWLVHGNTVGEGAVDHEYVFYRISDGWFARSPRFSRGGWIEGSLRLDASPCWNRDGTQVLVPAIAADGTRQLFVMDRP